MNKKIMKSLLTALIVTAASMTYAQSSNYNNGIKFEQQLKWGEILAKAKSEHKYIFVDCYATWCGPCKSMEEFIYPQKEVGDAYKNFICVKMQMDKTALDDSVTKAKYARVEQFEKDYTINAYPTFLFFDSNGRPVHKVTGALEKSAFIQLAEDAQNSKKQYYSLLKNFQIGKLDTAEERGLAYAFVNSDRELAGKIAADYLSRVPNSQLNQLDKGRLMVRFQYNPNVLNYAIAVIESYTKPEFIQSDHQQFISALIEQKPVMDLLIHYVKGLNFKEIERPANLNFIKDFAQLDNAEMQQLAINYIKHLGLRKMGQEKNLDFISAFRIIRFGVPDLQVKQLADRYINSLPQDSLYTIKNLRFIRMFTRSQADRGFNLFYLHPDKVDPILKDERFGDKRLNLTAHKIVGDIIEMSNWDPLFSRVKQTGETPDFNIIYKNIAQHYSKQYAYEIILDSKLHYYNYLVREKKQDYYWPQLIQSNMERDKQYLIDQTALNYISINNDCWDVYIHSDNREILNLADSLMAKIIKVHFGYDMLDTYASVLYKSGAVDQAITIEEQALHVSEKDSVLVRGFRAKIDAMKRGEKVWLTQEAYPN